MLTIFRPTCIINVISGNISIFTVDVISDSGGSILIKRITTLFLVVSSFLSGFISARLRTEKGLITGAITGLVFYLIVVVLSLVILRSAVTSSLIIKLAILCFASSIGGLLGVNRSAKYKKII